MEEVSFSSVTSREYEKRKNKRNHGYKGNKKHGIKFAKNTIFYFFISILFYLIVFSACYAVASIKSLWYDTLIKPPFIVPKSVFISVNLLFLFLMTYVFFVALKGREKALTVSLVINGVLYILLSYMFFGLKSSLGSLVILIVLVTQTITITSAFIKSKRVYGLIMILLILWQIYIMLTVYTILMLN